ncbi:hypothetical protein MF451_003760 [Salmonella enterica subsp. enterica serovar Saintpaul]|nr:hypothetical protein [Salmonella enterica subsp. enterica serovar Saintpaul]
MTDVVETTFELPTIEQVASVLAMCEKYDLPIAQLPDLWDKYTALQKVERRAGIQNGNMDREIKRLRELTAEQDKQLKAAYGDVDLCRLRISDLEETEITLRARVKDLEGLAVQAAPLLRQITELEDQRDRQQHLIEQQQNSYDELGDKYEALLTRCKHFEGISDQRRMADLEDLIEHYRCGMNGMKELAANKHFSHEWRLWLITRTLNVFEPTVKGQPNA